VIVQTKNDDDEEPITIVIDSTDLTITTKVTYIEDKWKKEGKEKVCETPHPGRQKKTGKKDSRFSRGVEEIEGLWKEVDRRDNLLLVQNSARRSSKVGKFLCQKAEAPLKVMLYNRFMSV
jgi:hypothetical protein